jgi:DNA-binding XRE family transcriptional regulator
MATKTRTIAGPRKVKAAITIVRVNGLQGRGLIQLGKESRLELRDRLQMPRVVFGRVVNVSERTIAKVEAEAVQVEKLRRPYNEVYRLCAALSEVVDPDSLGGWFVAPNDAFDGLKPIEVIERGEIDRLWEMVFRLRSGMPG